MNSVAGIKVIVAKVTVAKKGEDTSTIQLVLLNLWCLGFIDTAMMIYQ